MLGRCFAAFLFAVLLSPLAPRAAYVARPVTGYPHVRTSDHFMVLWTDTLGIPFNDAAADSGLKTLESIRSFYESKTFFPDKYANAAVQYKTNLYTINTGYAFGSGETVGGVEYPAMWVSPSGFQRQQTLAHEFAHTLQYGTRGFRDNAFVGWIWECHAEWMSHQMFPDYVGWGEQYTRTADLYYGTTRNRYGSWQFLEYLKETEGMNFVARIWIDGAAKPGSPLQADEDPIRAIMRLKGWDFAKFGDAWQSFAMRMARYDFKNGAVYRANWEHGRPDWQMRLTRTPLETVDAAQRRYVVPDVFAPQRYGYNIVRLRREAGQTRVRVVFRGVVQAASANPGFKKSRPGEPDSISAPGSGWRFGLVAVDTVRTAFRYSPVMASGEVSLDLAPAESEVYLVVSATPTNRQLIQWEQPYYTIYRYPWMCEVHGAWPDGLQPGAPKGPVGVAGGRHSNGGGFVAATATVAATAYVGPDAMVLGTAKVSGQARVEGHAIVGGTGEVRDQAVVSGYAGVWAGQVYGHARIDGAAQITQSGTAVFDNAHVGGRSFDSKMYEGGDAALSGSAQILGDGEIEAAKADHGVFYGYVGSNEAANAEKGANRTQPEPEITQAGPYAWPAPTSLLPSSPDARRAAWMRRLSLEKAGAGPFTEARDASGRRTASPAAGARGSLLPDGVFFTRP